MEIHSSSLAYIPNRSNANSNNDASQTVNKKSDHDNQKNQSALPLPPPQPVEKSFKATDFDALSNKINKQQNAPTNSRTVQAVNAYVQQDTQTLKNQRSELISGIDLFV